MIDYMDIEKKINEFVVSLPCTTNIPFPPVKVKEKNLEYANMLLDAYSKNCDGELQAITQYIYHHFTIPNEEISSTLLCIALIEMKHFSILGDLIEELGAKPKLYNSNMCFFNTGNIGYGEKFKTEVAEKVDNDNTCAKLKLDLLSERHAIQSYKLLIDEIADENIKLMLRKILSDEMLHAEILKNLIKKYCMEK